MNDELSESIDNILKEINAYIFDQEQVDTEHVYIYGTKITANTNKYSRVWKKASIKNRYKLFPKISALIEEMNQTLEMSIISCGFNLHKYRLKNMNSEIAD